MLAIVSMVEEDFGAADRVTHYLMGRTKEGFKLNSKVNFPKDRKRLSLHDAILAEFLFKMGPTRIGRAVRLHGVDIHVGSCGIRSSPSWNRLGPAVAL